MFRSLQTNGNTLSKLAKIATEISRNLNIPGILVVRNG